jgi:archaellum component FlaC
MNEEKNMTINDLARLMQGEFIGVKGEFTSVNKRLDVLEADVKFIKDNASELFTKLDEFISLYRDTKQELGLLAKQVNRLEERVVQLEGGK